MQPMTAIVLGLLILVPSVLALAYRLVLPRRTTVEIKGKCHHPGTAEGGESFLFRVELSDGTEEEVDVWRPIFRRYEVGDSVEVSFFQGPEWWGTSVYYGKGLLGSAWHLVPPLFMGLGVAMLIWGFTNHG